MGGTKKKSISQAEKAQVMASKKQDKKAKDNRAFIISKQQSVQIPKLDDQKVLKTLTSLKAITLCTAAKSLGVNASVTGAILRLLESKGLLKKVGGFSGHYVYTAVSS